MLMPRIFHDDLFDDFWEFPFDTRDQKRMEKKLYGHHGKNVMKTDIKETKDGYELEMDLPGFTKEEVTVSLENGNLTIRAAKERNQNETQKKSGRYIQRERYAGVCERTFYVGDALTQDDIKGTFRHGILTLTIPKKEITSTADTTQYINIE